MKRLLLLTIVLLFPITIYGQEAKSPLPPAQTAVAASPGWGSGAAATTPEVTTGEPTLKPMKLRKGLTWRQKRDMGLTYRNVRKVLAEMQANGEITDDLDSNTIAVMVAEKLVDDQPSAFQDPSLDWDAILAFLEKLIPLILKLIALFS